MLVIKVGGGETINWEGISHDLKGLWPAEKIILVHGASEQRDKLAAKLGLQVRTVTSPSGISSVYTDESLLDVFLMAYPGLVNKKIVALFNSQGLRAVGLSGLDGNLWVARQKKDILVKEGEKIKLLSGNLTGRVETINPELLSLLLANNYLPVVCSPAISLEGRIVNVDNDLAVAVMVESLKIKRVVFLLDKPGLLRAPDDEKTLIEKINRTDFSSYFMYAEGRMKKKMMAIEKILKAGAQQVFLADGRVNEPIFSALAGKGTIIA